MDRSHLGEIIGRVSSSGGEASPPKKKERKRKRGKGEREREREREKERCMVLEGERVHFCRIASDQYSLLLHDSII